MPLPQVTEATFDNEVLAAPLPVLVDFTASWCGPCRALAPILETIADDAPQKARVVKVDIDTNRGLASKFGIMAVPTIILFKNGKPFEKLVGLKPAAMIREMIDRGAA